MFTGQLLVFIQRHEMNPIHEFYDKKECCYIIKYLYWTNGIVAFPKNDRNKIFFRNINLCIPSYRRRLLNDLKLEMISVQ